MTDSPEKSLGTMPPDRIRFTQRSISYRFRDGRPIGDLADGLKSGSVIPETVPPIRVFELDGKYCTLDNRRLEAFRRAGVNIPYRMASAAEVAEADWKFSSKNDGASIRVRGEVNERPI
jgi:hypothetical protein